MSWSAWRLSLLLMGLTTAAWSAEEGLVAHYTFDEGPGATVRDVSGGGNDGVVHGAGFLRNAGGYCLELDGALSYVDCGDRPAFDQRQAITLEAWVMPTGRPNGEPGIMGKQFSRYLMTYYLDGMAYMYIGAGGNDATGAAPEGRWSLLTGTFDGNEIRMYVNGKLQCTSVSRFREIPSGGNFLIGCVAGAEAANDPNYRHTGFFAGLIDEVRVYSRALTAAEVEAHATSQAPELTISERFTPVAPAAAIGSNRIRCQMSRDGRLQVSSGAVSMTVDSVFAYPGDEVGWNVLGAGDGAEGTWRPGGGLSGGDLLAEGHGRFYHLSRRVSLDGGTAVVDDTITNLTTEPLGLMARHAITSERPFTSVTSPGGAENPTLLMQTPDGGLGIAMEDDISRSRFISAAGTRANQARFQWGNLAIAPGRSLRLRWVILPLSRSEGYFDFANRLRDRWHSNFTIAGPFNWISMTDPRLEDPVALKAWLDRKQVGVIALGEWLDYDPGSQPRVWTRDEYKAHAGRARDLLKAVQPDLKVVGCIETDWVTIYPNQIPGGDQLPVAGTGAGGGLTPEQTAILERSGLPWVDSAKRSPDGTMTLELYVRAGGPQTALAVYPAPGNHQAAFLMDQARFLCEDVGLDGFYIDEFSQAWNGGIATYGQWDGVSADLDPRTGRVARLYTDCGLAGTGARVALQKYAFDRGKAVIANTYSTTMEEQSLPANRFSETQGLFNPMAWADGEEPAAIGALLRSSLASPIGLGVVSGSDPSDTARRIMRAVVTYLRHGMLYYHYAIGDIPEDGPGSGAYGPINHMFPITITGLHEGWVEGRERVITCVSGSFNLETRRAPKVLVFDLDGRPVTDVRPEITGRGRWQEVRLNLKDWQQIAVIERQGTD